MVVNHAADRRAWREKVRRIEGAGFDTLVLGDHLGARLAPVPALMAAADGSERLRLGTTVFGNDWRNPVLLARDLATVDVLSDGRLEVGVGAGWRKEEYDALGVPWNDPGTRIGRLEEAIEILKGVWTQRAFVFNGEHYNVGPLDDEMRPLQTPHPPLLLGVGGPRSIALAGRLADIVNLTPRTRPDGTGIDPADATHEAFRRKCALLDAATEGRPDPPERGVMVLGVAVDEDVGTVAEKIGWSIGEHLPQLLAGPTFLAGSPSTIVDDLERHREELGLTYFVILEHAVERFASVLDKLGGR